MAKFPLSVAILWCKSCIQSMDIWRVMYSYKEKQLTSAKDHRTVSKVLHPVPQEEKSFLLLTIEHVSTF